MPHLAKIRLIKTTLVILIGYKKRQALIDESVVAIGDRKESMVIGGKVTGDFSKRLKEWVTAHVLIGDADVKSWTQANIPQVETSLLAPILRELLLGKDKMWSSIHNVGSDREE